MSLTSSFNSVKQKPRSNLERFLQYVTPRVPWRSLPQSCLHDLNCQWQQLDKDTIRYFTLGELWDCYDEWSAYGAGVPIQLNGHETAMQFYVPYLSAIQIYTSKPVAPPRNRRDDGDMAECESDSWSDDSWSDNLSRSLSNNSSRTWDAVSEDSSFDQEGSWPAREKLGYLSLQYIEMSSPYWRVPFMDKITELAQNYPALTTLRSVDLSPASWMAVSWYPIYHIPSQRNDKDFATCFLTYHTLSSSFQDSSLDYEGQDVCGSDSVDQSVDKSSSSTCLLPFGLATYRMQGDLWLKPETSDYERIVELYQAADSWLKQLGVHHHDFNFFNLHSTLCCCYQHEKLGGLIDAEENPFETFNSAEALGVSIILNKLNKRILKDEAKANAHVEQSEPDPLQSLDFLTNKQGFVWILESIVSEDFMDKAPREQKKKKDFLEVSPVKKYAKINDHTLVLLEPDGSKKTIQLKGCTIEAVSAATLPSRKWVKRFPLKLENRTSVIYNESKSIFIFLETSWEKESWCKALRLASCVDKERLKWFAKLHKEFHSYISSLSTGYPSFMKPSAGFYAEAIDKENKPNASSSKVRLFFKKLAKKTSKVGFDYKENSLPSLREERNISEKVYLSPDSISSVGLGKGIQKVKGTRSCFEEDMASSSTLSHSGSQGHTSATSDADPDDKFWVDEGTLCWNLLISRFFFDAKSNEELIKSLHERIQRMLSKMRTPSYVGEVICTKVNPGNLPANINAIRVLPFELNEVWALEVDFEYSGGFVLDIETRLEVHELDLQKSSVDSKSDSSYVGDVSSILEDFENLGKELSISEGTEPNQEDLGNSKNPTSSSSGGSRWKSLINSIAKQVSQVPISLAIKIASLRGTMRLQIKPPPSDQLWYGFTSMPDLDLRLESSVGDHKITSGHIAVFLINRVKAVIRDTLVLPNCESVYIPFMMAEKDDWVPRNVAPFIWLNQGASDNKPASEVQKSHPAEAKNRSEACKSTSTDQQEIENKIPKNTESSQPWSELSNTSMPSSSTVNPALSGTLDEMKIPLLGNDKTFENLQQNRVKAQENRSPSRSITLFGQENHNTEEDDTKPKKMGRKARMMEIGKKMGEKLEEKRRHIEEKSRNIVEKMRGP